MRILLALVLAAGCASAPRVRQNAAPAVENAIAAWLDGREVQLDEIVQQDPREARALYLRGRIHEEAGEFERAFSYYTRVLQAEAAGDPLWAALAHQAASRLESLAGELPGLNAQEAELSRIAPHKLPLEARRRLFAVLAWYARRRGDEANARKLDEAGGAPARWWVAGPYGRFPRLDLMKSFAPDGGGDSASFRAARSRMGQVTLEAPRQRAGVLYATQWVKASQKMTIVLFCDTDQPWRLFVDGRAVFDQIERDRFPARTAMVDVELSAGWHRVALKIGAPGGRVDVGLQLLADAPLEIFSGTPAEAPAVGGTAIARVRKTPVERAGNASQLLPLLVVEEALVLGDSDRAERALPILLKRAPKLATARLLEAAAALEDPSRPASIAQDRARRALARALGLDKHMVRARYLLANLDMQSDKPREALARLGDESVKWWRFEWARHQALKARGWQREAEEALAEARKLNPEACAPLDAAVTDRRDRHDLERARALAVQAARCDGGSEELADLLRDQGDLDGAIAEYERLLTLDAARESWRAGLAETHAQAGRVKIAAQIWEALLANYPRRTQYRRQLADAYVSLGELSRARRVLEDGLAETPERGELHRALEALCDHPERRCGVLDELRLDGREVMSSYKKSGRKYDSPAVIVLDRTVTRVFPTGARLTLTHNIIQVLAKDGIDKWGEVTVPDGADVIVLRTVKKDGTTREPEEIAEKETISVPDLDVGDFVEFEYVDPAPPPAAFPDGFLAERFYFRSFDAPLDRTEYVLVTPAGMPLLVDKRGDAPAPTLRKSKDLEVRVWADRGRPQAFQEPAAAPFSETLASVRAGSGLSLPLWRDYLRDSALFSLRANEELRQIAARVTRDHSSPVEKLRALDAFVRKRVKHGGLLDEQATAILARDEGNRVTILAALARAAGIDVKLALARGNGAARLDGELPDLEGHDQAVLLHAGGVVHPQYRHAPTGFVAPSLRAASAFVLDDSPARLITLSSENPDDRKMEMAVDLARDGAGAVTIKETLRGWPAVQWREALDKLPSDQVRPQFEQHTLGVYFPGSTLEELAWKGHDDDEGPLVVEYRFSSPQLARRVGDRLVLPAPFPATLGRRYVGVASRTMPLQVEYAAPTRVRAEVNVAEGLEVELPPPARADQFGKFEQVAKKTARGLSLEALFAMPHARVAPERYREFVEFATRVDRAEARAAEIVLH